ncbi:MAG: hypothetical protein RLZZ590_959 [Actinomycetota bacterium]|jgi:hypothetical protein
MILDIWTGILLASIAVYSWKLIGFLVPSSVLNRPVVSRSAALLTVALLSALLGIQGFTADSQFVLDARMPALAVGAVLLWMRAPFIVMVAAAAATAAIIRLIVG